MRVNDIRKVIPMLSRGIFGAARSCSACALSFAFDGLLRLSKARETHKQVGWPLIASLLRGYERLLAQRHEAVRRKMSDGRRPITP